MRRIALISFVAAALVACSTDTTSPTATPPTGTDQVTQFEIANLGTEFTSVGGFDAELFHLGLFHGLPDELELTSEQEAKIKALVEAYKEATKADRDALDAILKEARKALKGKRSTGNVAQILARGAPIAARLAEAAAKLKAAIEAVLTPEQREWLASHAPKHCLKHLFPPLTDAQKAEMKAIHAEFEEANRADLRAVKEGFKQIRHALFSGKSPGDIQKILDEIRPAVERLAVARKALHEELISVLTADQKASGCLPLG